MHREPDNEGRDHTRYPGEKATKLSLSLLHAGAWIVILTNFAWFNWKVPQSPFAPDEMMNMGWAWEAGLLKILGAIAAFFTNFYRPMGALYYWVLYNLFGLNYVPFRTVDLCILLLNLWLAFCLFRRLSGSLIVAYLSAFLFSYNANVMSRISYNGAFVYDRICFTFYVGAFLFYLRRRSKGEPLNLWSAAVVAVLYAFALDSKEMAVSLPPVLLAFELLYNPIRSLSKNWRPLLLLTLMTLAYVYGKTHGSEALLTNAAYRPVDITLNHFLTAQAGYVDLLLLGHYSLTPLITAGLILAAALLAAAFRSRCLWIALVYMLLTPLPIAFLDRGTGRLYLPLLGWCLFAAQLSVCVANLLSSRAQSPRRYFVGVVVQGALAVVLIVTLIHRNLFVQSYVVEPMLKNGALTWQIIQDFNRIRPQFRPNDKVYITNSPFAGWDVIFITELWANVRPLHIFEPGKNLPPGAAVPPGTNVILSFDAAKHMSVSAVQP